MLGKRGGENVVEEKIRTETKGEWEYGDTERTKLGRGRGLRKTNPKHRLIS